MDLELDFDSMQGANIAEKPQIVNFGSSEMARYVYFADILERKMKAVRKGKTPWWCSD
jgi:hypothetical protein